MSAILSRPHCVKHKVAFHAVTWVHSALRLSDPKYTRTVSQQAANVIITPLLHQNDVVTSFWRNNDVIVTQSVHRNVTPSLSLRWRHNERDSVSNYQPHVCLLNRLFTHRSKKASKLRVTGLNAGNSSETGEFPAQRSSNAENGSIWWRYHDSNQPITCEPTGHAIYHIDSPTVTKLGLWISLFLVCSVDSCGEPVLDGPHNWANHDLDPCCNSKHD